MVCACIPTGETEGKRTGHGRRECRAVLNAKVARSPWSCSARVVELHDAPIHESCGQRSRGEAELGGGPRSVQGQATAAQITEQDGASRRERLCPLRAGRADYVFDTGEVAAGVGGETTGESYRTIRIEAGEHERIRCIR